MKKCKYYLRKSPDCTVSSCGYEVDYEYDTYCTFCGKEIKEPAKEVPSQLIDTLERGE